MKKFKYSGNDKFYEALFACTVYDSKGRLIYSEYSDGSWIKNDYDFLGNPIYCEYSDGDGYFSYYEGNSLIKRIYGNDYKTHYLNYKRNVVLNTLLNEF